MSGAPGWAVDAAVALVLTAAEVAAIFVLTYASLLRRSSRGRPASWSDGEAVRRIAGAAVPPAVAAAVFAWAHWPVSAAAQALLSALLLLLLVLGLATTAGRRVRGRRQRRRQEPQRRQKQEREQQRAED
ncbi:hypothetical protein ACGF13_26440 [Kitasatospora sp. NPDC048286]|uniref:hypothetical protein n=1 Tax=Kitasatospora sp. NPDC048286 TaxID=3364047 RepID=UPI00371F2AAC